MEKDGGSGIFFIFERVSASRSEAGALQRLESFEESACLETAWKAENVKWLRPNQMSSCYFSEDFDKSWKN